MCREPSPNGCRSTEAFCRRAVTSCYCSLVIHVGDGFDRSMGEIVVAHSHKTVDRDACSAACMPAEDCSNLNAGLGSVWPSPKCKTRCKDLQATGCQASSFPELRHPAERHRRSFRITLKLKLLACCRFELTATHNATQIRSVPASRCRQTQKETRRYLISASRWRFTLTCSRLLDTTRQRLLDISSLSGLHAQFIPVDGLHLTTHCHSLRFLAPINMPPT